jgi:hypothetical protein
MGSAYAEFDKKIGYSESGDPVPSQDQYQGFGRADLAAMAIERYPTTAALIEGYRQYAPRPSGRRDLPRQQEIEGFGDEEPLEDDFGDNYDDDYQEGEYDIR